MSEPIHIISLGAGVQSSCMSLMAAAGEITPMPTAAIFADTQAEPKSVYAWLDWLEKQLPFPVYRVTQNNGLLEDLKQAVKGGRCGNAPFFTESKNGGGMLRRTCTTEFKRDPIRRKIREMLGLAPKQRAGNSVRVVLWIGISLDEVSRIKENGDVWIENKWPLIERRMSRHGCLKWMEKHGFPNPPKSSCTFCPYHSDAHWSRLKNHEPEAFAQAVEVDDLIRNGVGGTKERLFVHSSLRPLSEVDFSTEEERGQLSMFNNECEGMCGV